MMRRFPFVAAVSVLILAGWAANSSATTGTWIAKAPMPTARKEIANATVVLNDQIYVLGGVRASDGARTGVVERYDPASDSWETLSPLLFDVWRASAATANGKVYIFGGNRTFSFPFTPTNRVFEYDPGTDTWTERASMPTNRGTHTAVAVGGRIHVLGGANSAALATHEIFDPVANTWATGAAIPADRSGLTADLLGTDILVVGGYRLNGGLVTLKAHQAYDTVTQLWDTSPQALPVARLGIDAAVANGHMYVFGGATSAGVPSRSLEYDPVGNQWRQMADMPDPGSFMGVAAVRDTIYVMGGGPLNLNRFDGIDANWAFVPPSHATAVPSVENGVKTGLRTSSEPNPFSSSTVIRYSLSASADVSVRVYDVQGRPVRTLVRGVLRSGEHTVTWDGRNDVGHGVAAGVYFYRVGTPFGSSVRKVQLRR